MRYTRGDDFEPQPRGEASIWQTKTIARIAAMTSRKNAPLRFTRFLFPVGHFLISLFITCGVALIVFSCIHLWQALGATTLPIRARIDTVLESLALVTVALAVSSSARP